MAARGRWILLFALPAALAAPAQVVDAACHGEATCQDSRVHGDILLQREAVSQERAATLSEAEGQDEAMGELGVPKHVEEELFQMQDELNAHRGMTNEEVARHVDPGWLDLKKSSLHLSKRVAKPYRLTDGHLQNFAGGPLIVIDLGTVFTLTKQKLWWRFCDCEKASSMRLLGSSDGKQWYVYQSIGGFKVRGGLKVQEYSLPSIQARYVAIKPIEAKTKWAVLYEIALFGAPKTDKPNTYGWWHSYQGGTQALSGTEMVHLWPYKGRLFGGTGYWMHSGSFRPAEVTRLDSPMSSWIVETQLSPYAGRAESLQHVVFTTDRNGNKLSQPVSKLLSGYYMSLKGHAQCNYIARNDATSQWDHSTYYTASFFKKNYFSARALALKQDTVTGVDIVFYATGMDGIATGVYCDHCLTKIEFAAELEGGPVETRPLGLAVMDKKIFFTASSYIKRRRDGTTPVWEKVFDMSEHDDAGTVDEAVGGLRGITTISNPQSPTGKSLFFSWAPNAQSGGCMVRLDPNGDGFTFEKEKCVRGVESLTLGRNIRNYLPLVTFAIAAYNFVLEIRPDVHLIGFQALLYAYSVNEFPVDTAQRTYTSSNKPLAYHAGAGFLVRRGPKHYHSREPGGPRFDPMQVYPKQTAVRCLAKSPFNDGKVFMGGYDCNHFHSQNTAWVQSGTWQAVWGKPVKCQRELGCGHTPGAMFRKRGCYWWPQGAEFQPDFVATWRNLPGGKRQPLLCQTMLDWVNKQSANNPAFCTKARAWPFMKNCAMVRCNICGQVGTTFRQTNTAGYSQGHAYDCKAASDTVTKGKIQCDQAQKWWSGKCCS